MSAQEIEAYGEALIADILATADAENAVAPEVFTRRVLEDLEQAGEVENTFVAYHRAHGLEVSGYGENETLDTLDLFITHFSLQPFAEKLTRTQADTLFKRLATFVRRCRDGLSRDIDEGSDVHDMCTAVEKHLADTPRLRFFLLTDLVASGGAPPPGDLDGLAVSYEVWDLARQHRMATSGTLSEPIVVEFPSPLPCLTTPDRDRDYSVLLAIMPGAALADLYGRYGTRLLELNVRSFLQSKGGVNRGIRETLLHNPDRFLAYNNGITATASKVELTRMPDGSQGISRLHDLQIVNGGQTTASIHYAHVRDKADVGRVFVQMKLTVVSPQRLMDIVPEISKYSNTQNKVTAVDFSSNHPYHVAVEKVTRSLWAPAVDGSGQETKWFYERARGQYTDALARERTPANQKKFRTIHPVAQKFSKADAAKFAHSWDQKPHLVSRGAEKNFREFMLAMGDEVPVVDVSYCQRLIAKAILFKAVDKVVGTRAFGGYKINITTYTLARLVHATGGRIDLDRIWREQGVSPAVRAAVDEMCGQVREVILAPRRGTNVGEWTKRADCWEAVLEFDWTVPSDLEVELADQPVDDRAVGGGNPLSGDVATVMAMPPADWFGLSKWAKESDNLKAWQRQLAYNIGKYINNGWNVSDRMALQGLRLMEEARDLGFRTTAEL
jgi:hypothetical protein